MFFFKGGHSEDKERRERYFLVEGFRDLNEMVRAIHIGLDQELGLRMRMEGFWEYDLDFLEWREEGSMFWILGLDSGSGAGMGVKKDIKNDKGSREDREY